MNSAPLSPSTQQRTAISVWRTLLSTMAATVTDYHPSVIRTPTSVEQLIDGTAFFPGGSGLWRGLHHGGSLPEVFPQSPVMFVAHNLDSAPAFARNVVRRGEANGSFWKRLTTICSMAGLVLEECFFTNALMGLQPEKAQGKMPATADYLLQCGRFLRRQAGITKARLVVTLGQPAKVAFQRSQIEISRVHLRHPSGLTYVPDARRKEWLNMEAEFFRAALEQVD